MWRKDFNIFAVFILTFFAFVSSITVSVYSSQTNRRRERDEFGGSNPCPFKCRCVSLNHRGARDLLDGLESGWRSGVGPVSSYGRAVDPDGRSMFCQGLRRLPKPVPSDIFTLTIYGDSSGSTPKRSPGQQNDDRPLISESQLRYIERDVFSNNYLLHEVTLSGNNIGVLYPYVFNRLRNLRKLSLPSNNIRHLSAAVFRGLRTLDALDLSDNVIRRLPQTVFNFIPNVKSLKLNGNKISRLQRNQFKLLIYLQNLDLSRNNITDFYDDTFDKNVRLQELLLSGNRISTIRPRWFSNLYGLRALSLRGNVISQINSESFSGLQNLEELLLSANVIGTIGDDSFKNLKKLKVLDLATNDISEVHSSLFSGLIALEELYLGSNQLMSVSAGIFSDMTNLQRIDLSRNHMEDLEDQTFSSLSNIKYIDLSHNKLRSVRGNSFLGLSELKELRLENNFINRVEPSAFFTVSPAHTSKLTTINLQFNVIRKLEADSLSGMPNLKTLNLQNNRLKRIHSLAFASLDGLQTLNMNNNRLKKLSNGLFRRLHRLLNIDLSNNKLRSLPGDMFSGLDNVENLNLGSNGIYDISPNVFKSLNGLVELSLEGNKLMNFNFSLVERLQWLSVLDLSDNHLFWISVPKSVRVGLKELFLSENNLHTIKKDLQTLMKNHASLFVAGNPLSCDCNVAWMLDPLVTRQLSIDGIGNLLCRTPIHNHGKTLIDLQTDELTCDTKSRSEDNPSLVCTDAPNNKVAKYSARTGAKALMNKYVTVLNSERSAQFGGVLIHRNWALVPGNAVKNTQQSTTENELKVKVGRRKGLRRIHHVIRHPLGNRGMEQYNLALLHLEADDKGYPICLMTVNQYDTFSRIISKSTFTTRVSSRKSSVFTKLKSRRGKIRPKCSNANYLCVKIGGKNGRNKMLLDGSPLYLGLAGDYKLAGIGTNLRGSFSSDALFIPLWTMTEWINKVIQEYDTKCPIKSKTVSDCSHITLPSESELLAKSSMVERH